MKKMLITLSALLFVCSIGTSEEAKIAATKTADPSKPAVVQEAVKKQVRPAARKGAGKKPFKKAAKEERKAVKEDLKAAKDEEKKVAGEEKKL